MANPSADLVTFLAGAGLGFIKGTNLFQGDFRGPDTIFPIEACFIGSLPGPESDRIMGRSKEIRYYVMTIRLRWSRFAAGNLKARAIQNELQDASISGYLDIVATQSQPNSLGESAEGHHLWSFGITMIAEETA